LIKACVLMSGYLCLFTRSVLLALVSSFLWTLFVS